LARIIARDSKPRDAIPARSQNDFEVPGAGFDQSEYSIPSGGVSIAARLEGIAQSGGICISDDAHRQIRGKVDFDFDDMGPQILKNITEPIRAWRREICRSCSSAAMGRLACRPCLLTGQYCASPS
jgi:hypothetical protein